MLANEIRFARDEYYRPRRRSGSGARAYYLARGPPTCPDGRDKNTKDFPIKRR